jgi:hypothetical protein
MVHVLKLCSGKAINTLAGLLGYTEGFIHGATRCYNTDDGYYVEGKQARVRPDVADFVTYSRPFLCFNAKTVPFSIQDIRNALKLLPVWKCTLTTSDGHPCPGYDARRGSPANCGYHQTCSNCGTNDHVEKVDTNMFACQKCLKVLSRCQRCKCRFFGEKDFCSLKCVNLTGNAKSKTKKPLQPPVGYLGNVYDQNEILLAWKAHRAAVQNGAGANVEQL